VLTRTPHARDPFEFSDRLLGINTQLCLI